MVDPFDELLNPVPVDPVQPIFEVDYASLELRMLAILGLTLEDVLSWEHLYDGPKPTGP